MIIGPHIVKSVHHDELTSDSTLHVVAMVSNPARFQSRYRLFRDFMARMEATKNVAFYVVELAFADRQFEVTDPNHPRHLQLRASQEIWHKENGMDLGVKHLFPKDWKYMAWLDGDITFMNPGWALEAIHQLQHYPVIQPWSECVDLGPYGNAMQVFESFGSVHQRGVPKQMHPSQPYKYSHSGFAWACTRYFWENVGGLIDFAILGSADHHMAFSMIGEVKNTIHGGMTQGFRKLCLEWQDRACHVTHGMNVGCMKGLIHHNFHGKKADRKYRERWDIFVDNQFDPTKDLARDSQGLYYIVNKPKLIADIRNYFRQRNEDSIDQY